MVDIEGQCFRRFATSPGSITHVMNGRRCGKFWEIAAKMLRGWTEPLYQRTRDMYYLLHSARSHSAIETLFPSCRLVALLAQTTIYQLPIGWLGRFRPKQSLKERLSKATDAPPTAPAAAPCAACPTIAPPAPPAAAPATLFVAAPATVF